MGCLPASGEEWTLAIFSSTDWLVADDEIPDNMPAAYTALLIGIEFDDVADEIGLTLATVDSLSVSAVPVPAAVWLFGSALAALGWRRR